MGPKAKQASSFLKRPLTTIATRAIAIIFLVLVLQRLSTIYYVGTNPPAFDITSDDELAIDDAEISQEADRALVNEKHPATNTNTTSGPSKAIVIASVAKEDTSWVRDNFPDWDRNIYIVDDANATLTVPKKQGREAAVYLTYIIKQYHSLPEYIVFAHAQRYQWHNDDPMYDGVNPIRMLRLPHVADQGYVPLRCAWKPGCPAELRRGVPKPAFVVDINLAFFHTFRSFFPAVEQPNVVGAPCCAQFAVTGAQVRKRPLSYYRRVRHWLWTTNLPSGVSGRILEYAWHAMMGQPPVSCPRAKDCYCKAFGLCHLKCPNDRMCLGRYKGLAWYQHHFPEGWPHNHKANGFPKDKWWEEWYPPDRWDGFEPKNNTLSAESG